MDNADPRHLGAPAAGKPILPDASCCQLHGLVSCGDGQIARHTFATIVEAVREGRAILDNIRKFLRYLLSSNTGEVLTMFLGVVGAGMIGLNQSEVGAGGTVVLPLLATQLPWINLITDSGPALAMGVDLTTARTAGFTVLVFTSLFTCFTCFTARSIYSELQKRLRRRWGR